MSTEIIEQQLAELQQRVAKLEAKPNISNKGNWREAIGFAKDDTLFREAMKLGSEWREKANMEGR